MSISLGFSLKKVQGLSQRLMIYFPFRAYLLYFLLFSGIAQVWLMQQSDAEPSLFNDILFVLLKLIKTFFIPLVAFAFLTAFLPFFLFWVAYRQRRIQISLQSPDNGQEGSPQNLQLYIAPLWQPLFGHLYFRLQYAAGEKISPEFSLINKANAWGFSGDEQKGWFRWPIPGIRLYEVDTLIITLEDFFHFFSFSIPVKANQFFATRPASRENNMPETVPATSETEEIRIPEWRRVQGEMLHYKAFDSSDDVRRIVWKIYARNKELVVRTPELLNPFASHIEAIAFFYDGIHLAENHVVAGSCIDYFKTACYNIIRKVKEQGQPVNFRTDVEDTGIHTQNKHGDDALVIAKAMWQQHRPPQDTGSLRKISLACISSLVSPAAMEYVLENLPHTATVVFVPLSKAAPAPRGWQWLKWIWVETEKDIQNRFPFLWFISPARRQLQKNEERLLQIIKEHGKKCVIFETEK
jgi:hypothetical protein